MKVGAGLATGAVWLISLFPSAAIADERSGDYLAVRAIGGLSTIDGITGIRVHYLEGGDPVFLTEGEWVAWSAG